MKHDFYLLLTLGSSNAGDETHSVRCSAPYSRAGVLLSHGLQRSRHAELGPTSEKDTEKLGLLRRS